MIGKPIKFENIKEILIQLGYTEKGTFFYAQSDEEEEYWKTRFIIDLKRKTKFENYIYIKWPIIIKNKSKILW